MCVGGAATGEQYSYGLIGNSAACCLGFVRPGNSDRLPEGGITSLFGGVWRGTDAACGAETRGFSVFLSDVVVMRDVERVGCIPGVVRYSFGFSAMLGRI